MKRLPFICVCICAYFLFQSITALAQNNAIVPAIESIRVVADEGSPEKVIIKLNASSTPRTFRLDGEKPRLVLDFFEVRYPSNKTFIEGAGGDIVADVRTGRHRNPLKTRVVIDIVPGSPYEYEQTFNVSNNSLLIAFYPGFPGSESGAATRHIQVGNAKIIHGTAPAEVKQEISQEKQESEEEVEKQEPEAEVEKQEPEAVVEKQEPEEEVEKQEPEAVVEKQEPEEEVEKQEPEAVVEKQEPEAAVEKQEPEPVVEKQEPEDQAPPVILDVSFEQSINNSETVLFKLSHFYPPLVFGIEKGEPRVVCDFHDAEVEADVPPEIEAGGKYVNRITVETLKDPDKVRVTLELVPNHHYDLQQLFFKEDNLFVVIVNELKESGAAAN